MARYRLRRPREQRGLTPQQIWGTDWLGATNSIAGVRVSAETALNAPAIWACVRLISNDIAGLPLNAYRREGDSRTKIALPEWIERPFPDPNVTRGVHFAQVVTSLLLEGNAFIRFLPSVLRPEVLQVLDPSTVEIRDYQGGLQRRYRVRGEAEELTPLDIVHIPFVVMPGKARGMNPVDAARETIGLSLAADQYGAAFFGNGAHLSGFISFPAGTNLSPETVSELKEKFTRQHVGARKSHSFGILTGDAKWNQLTASNRDSQFLELRRYQVEDIARMYGVPPHLLGSQEPGAVSYASVEQRSIDYVSKAIQPIVERIEDAYTRAVRGQRTYLKFTMEGLLRADVKTRWETYQIALQNKVLTGDEVRAKEDLDPAGLGFLETPNNNPPAPPAEPAEADEEEEPRAAPISFVLPGTIDVPAPQVTVEPVVVPAPTVTIDTAPFAAAVERMAEGMDAMRAGLDTVREQVTPRPEVAEQEVTRDESGRIVEIITRGTAGTRRKLVHRNDDGRVVRIEEIAI